mgnify:CR=1 FL=1
MTDAEKRLRELAQVATPGPWRLAGTEKRPCPVVSASDSEKGYQVHSMLWVKRDTPDIYDGMRDTYNRDAAFIAAANPAAVLALLARIEALESEGAALVADLQEQDARVEALTTAAQRVVGELRHALKYPDVGGTVDTDIVRRAVVLLEEATTPGRPEETP